MPVRKQAGMHQVENEGSACQWENKQACTKAKMKHVHAKNIK